ncbi:MAG: hypothetical protein WD940_00120, partial [Patescibacteria group bacterium]
VANLNADLLDGQTGSYYLDWLNFTNKPTIVSSVDGVSNNEGDIDLIAGANITITPNDLANTITFDIDSSGLDADTLDGLDSLQFLRSDTSDNYTSGTLTFDSGTILLIDSGGTLSVDGEFTTADTTLDFTGGNTTIDLAAAALRTLTITNSNGANVANLSVEGDVSGNTLTSTVATGTAPLTVASTTLVANLNADLLDGQTGSYYLDLDNETGTCSNCLTTTEIDESTFTGLNSTNIDDIYLFNTGDTATGDYDFDSGTLFVDSANDLIGIGDITPDGKLDVEPTGAVTAASYGVNLSNLTTNSTTDGINKYGAYITSTGAWAGSGGTATNNYGLYVDTVSGADNNYGAYFANNVGIGTTTPTSKFQIGTDTVVQQWSGSTPYVLIQGVDNEVATPAFTVKDENLGTMFELTTTGDSTVGRAYFGGNVGILTNAPVGNFSVNTGG